MASNSSISVDEEAPGLIESEIRDSPFGTEEEEEPSSSSNSDSSESREDTGEEDDDGEADPDDQLGAEPYRFEPVLPPGEHPRRPPVGDDQMRLETLDWCQCGNCTRMPTVLESICCREVDQVRAKVAEVEGLECLTSHEAFWRVALDTVILDIAFIGYNRDRRRIGNGNRRYRYTAYRQIVRWCWGILGRKNRVPIPACIKKIGDTFPHAEGEDRTGFLYPPRD